MQQKRVWILSFMLMSIWIFSFSHKLNATTSISSHIVSSSPLVANLHTSQVLRWCKITSRPNRSVNQCCTRGPAECLHRLRGNQSINWGAIDFICEVAMQLEELGFLFHWLWLVLSCLVGGLLYREVLYVLMVKCNLEIQLVTMSHRVFTPQSSGHRDFILILFSQSKTSANR